MHDRLEELDGNADRRFKIADYNICEVMGHGFNAAMVTYAASTSSLAALLAGVGAIGIDGYFKLVGSIPLNTEKARTFDEKSGREVAISRGRQGSTNEEGRLSNVNIFLLYMPPGNAEAIHYEDTIRNRVDFQY